MSVPNFCLYYYQDPITITIEICQHHTGHYTNTLSQVINKLFVNNAVMDASHFLQLEVVHESLDFCDASHSGIHASFQLPRCSLLHPFFLVQQP